MSNQGEWAGTFEIWQNPKFGEIYTKNTGKQRLFVDNVQIFVSRKPLIGNTTLYVYCSPQDEKWFKDLLSLARKLRTGRVWIYTVGEMPVLRRPVQSKVFTFIIDLTLSEDEIWKRMKSGLRNEIRRAQREGVVVKEAKTNEEFNKWYSIYNATASIKGFEYQSHHLVEELFEQPDLSKLFVALLEDKIVGGMFFLTGGYPMYWLGGFDRKYSHFNIGALSMYEAMLQFKNKGYRLLDLGGAVLDKEHGPTLFKRKFGGKVREAKIYGVPINRLKSNLLTFGETLQKCCALLRRGLERWR